MALSAFNDRSHQPTEGKLQGALGKAHQPWIDLIASVALEISPLSKIWGFTSANTGWGLRLKHKDRVVLYMTPQAGKFLVSFALGEKAVTTARQARLPAKLMKVIEVAPKYAEGRGIRVEVTSTRQIPSLVKLAQIKFQN